MIIHQSPRCQAWWGFNPAFALRSCRPDQLDTLEVEGGRVIWVCASHRVELNRMAAMRPVTDGRKPDDDSFELDVYWQKRVANEIEQFGAEEARKRSAQTVQRWRDDAMDRSSKDLRGEYDVATCVLMYLDQTDAS